MAKEWLLNSVANRFQLNFKRNVGAVSEAIRKCAPKTIDEWEEYYFNNIRTREQIIELGKRLYIKISEIIRYEIDSITEEDCIEFMFDLVIRRTFEGYKTEIDTIYGQLQKILNINIEPAPDEWDRKYNVDFFIKVNDKFIGLQIKPISDVAHIPEIYKERGLQEKSHIEFTKKFGGNVFYIFSKKNGDKKVIYNIEVIEQIKNEINRLLN